jgi:pimeloyl-ACP methyl ester carboxylesterase
MFLHGVARRWQTFQPLFPLLPAGWTVSGFDLRGHGDFDRATRCLVAEYAHDILHLVRHSPTPPALYGSSLGALVAVWVAAELPRGVRGVILEDPPSPEFLADLPQTTYQPTFRAMQSVAGRAAASVGELAHTLARAPIGERDGRTLTLADVHGPVSLRFTARCLQFVDPNVFTP